MCVPVRGGLPLGGSESAPAGPESSPTDSLPSAEAQLVGAMPLVLQTCRRWAATESEARELCQDALLVAWRRRSLWPTLDHLPSWICGVARNLGRNARRKRRETRLDPRHPEATATGRSPVEQVVAKQEIDAVQTALADLPPIEQEVLRLRYAEGWPTHRIDAALGLQGSGARAVLQRGRRRLRRALWVHGPEAARLAG